MKKVIITIKQDKNGGFTATLETAGNLVHTTLRHASYNNCKHAAMNWIWDNLGDPDIIIKSTRHGSKASELRRLRNQAYKDLGLKKVRGALGGTYWEWFECWPCLSSQRFARNKLKKEK